MQSTVSSARAPVMSVTSYTPTAVVDSTRQMTPARASALAQPLNASSLSSTSKNSGSCRTTCTITPRHERNRTLPLSPPYCTRASEACHQLHAHASVVYSTRQMTPTRASTLAQPLNASSFSSTSKNSGSRRTTRTITPKHERNRTLPLSPPCCTRASDACH